MTQSIIASVVLLASTMRLDITAEGVEKMEQLQMLRSLGCPTVQGYLFGAPTGADQVRIDQRAEARALDVA